MESEIAGSEIAGYEIAEFEIASGFIIEFDIAGLI